MCRSAEATLDCLPESVAFGRRFISDALEDWGVTSGDPAGLMVDDLLLVASELLANAVRACAGPIVLSLEAHRDRLHLSVRDDNRDRAHPSVADRGALGGRGLGIVGALVSEWGQSDFDGATKDVWADLALGPGSVLAVHCTQ